jgi:signal peptidase
MSSPGEDDRTERPDTASPSDDSGQRPGDTEPKLSREAATDERSPSREAWRSGDPTADRPPKRQADSAGQSDAKLFVYDLLSSVLAVAVVGAYLFAVSGVWPPLVAVESRSMVPNMQVNDLVFVMEEDRFPGEMAEPGTGVVTAQTGGTSYTKFGGSGDVIVFEPDGNDRTTPIIHRAMYWVEAGENWCTSGDSEFLRGLDSGDERCTADHAGFITKGDNNAVYDQATSRSGPVKPEWVVGTAEFRIPGLGWIRLSTQ